MKQFYKLIFVFLLVSGSQLKGQQLPLTNQYLVSPYLLSPAFAGYNENPQVFLTYRKEWGNDKGSPHTAFINADFPVSERVWLGAEAISDQTDISKVFFAQMSYTYHLPLGSNTQLYFGLWGSVLQNSINLDGAIVSDPNDPVLVGQSRLTGTALNAGSSLIFRWKNGSIGLTVPYLFTSNDAYIIGEGYNLMVIEKQIIAHFTYNIRLNYDLVLQPFFVYRSIENSPYHYDLSLRTIYRDDYWGALTYRNGGKIGFSLGGNLTKQLSLNYTYEFATQGMIAKPSPVHEFSVGFNIGSGDKYKPNRWKDLLQSQRYNNFN